MTATDRRVLTRLAGHFDAAVRLRTRPESAIAGVASPEGELVDIDDPAAKPIRTKLASHIVSIERAQLRARRHELDAIDDWQALVAGRYTIVPREDTDGKRHYLLVTNPPYVEAHARFNPREINVLRMAARGFTNKTMAYTLGSSPAATSSALAAAAAKVGLASRHDLVAVARTIFGFAGGAHGTLTDDSRLTPVEREIFALLRRGMSNVQIAALRQRSVHTVANQVSSILAKLSAPSRRALGPGVRRPPTPM